MNEKKNVEKLVCFAILAFLGIALLSLTASAYVIDAHEEVETDNLNLDTSRGLPFDNPNFNYKKLISADSNTVHRNVGINKDHTMIVSYKTYNDATSPTGIRKEVFLYNTDGSGETMISFGNSQNQTQDIWSYQNPMWSDDPDIVGFQEIHYANPNKVIAYDTNGTLTTSDDSWSYIYAPTSNDVANFDFLGSSTTEIVFWTYGYSSTSHYRADLFIWNGTTLTNITNSDFKEYEPVSNPAGDKILYWSGEVYTPGDPGYEPYRTTHLLTYNTTSGGWDKDVDFTPINDTYWSYFTSDASKIVLSTNATNFGLIDLHVYETDGTFDFDLTGPGYPSGTGNNWNFVGMNPDGPLGSYIFGSNQDGPGRDVYAAWPKQSVVYVDDDWAGSIWGEEVSTGKYYGMNAFSDVQNAIDNVTVGGTVNVAEGSYCENTWYGIYVWKEVTLSGPNTGVCGTDVRDPEAILHYPTGLTGTGSDWSCVLYIVAENVTIDGFTINDNGYDSFTGYAYFTGIYAEDSNNTVISNNIIEGFNYTSMLLSGGGGYPASTPTSGTLVDCNYVKDNFGLYHAIYLQGVGGTVIDNTVDDCGGAVQIQPYSQPIGGTVINNAFSTFVNGVYYNYANNGAGKWYIEENDITRSAAPSKHVFQSGVDNSHLDLSPLDLAKNRAGVNWSGLYLRTFAWSDTGADPEVEFNDNYVDGSGATDSYWNMIRAVQMRTIKGNGISMFYGNDLLNTDEGTYIYDNANVTNIAMNYNNFIGNTAGVNHNGIGLLDATCNWWNDDSGPSGQGSGSGESVSTNVDYLPWLDRAYPNGDCVGGLCADPIWVDDDAASSWYDWDHVATIQTAVDRICDGGTIYVEPGEYSENTWYGTYIYKEVTLLGPNAGLPGTSSSRGPEAVIHFPDGFASYSSSGNAYLMYVGADNVTIDGLKFTDENHVDTVTNHSGAIYCSGSYMTVGNTLIQNNVVEGFSQISIRHTGSGGYPMSTPLDGVQIIDNYLTGNNGNSLSGYKYHSIYMQGVGGLVSGNTINNSVAGIQIQPYSQPIGGNVTLNTIDTWGNGIWHNYANYGSGKWIIEENTITAGTVPSSRGPGTGFTHEIVDDQDGLTVADADPIYIQATRGPVNWSGLQIMTFAKSGTGAAPEVEFVNNMVDGIDISNTDYDQLRAVFIQNYIGDDGKALYMGNTFTNCDVGTYTGYYPGSSATPGYAGFAIHFNNYVGNTMGVNNIFTSQLNATCNWWGSGSGPTHASNGYNIGFQGESISDNVKYCPYLDDTYPTGVCMGPVQNTRTNEYFCGIQEGIDEADTLDGDTLTIAAGTYQESAHNWVDIDLYKELTLLGAGSDQTIIHLHERNNPSGAHMDGMSISASNVTVEGMTFTKIPGNNYACGFNIRAGINVHTPPPSNTFENIVLRDVESEYSYSSNVIFDGGYTYENVLLENCNIHHSYTERCFYQSPSVTMDGFSVINSHFDHAGYGDPNVGSPMGFNLQGTTNDLTITGGTFNQNPDGGIGIRRTTNAVIEDVLVNHSGYSTWSFSGIGVWEDVGTTTNIQIINPTVTNCGGRGMSFGTWSHTVTDISIVGGLVDNSGNEGIMLYAGGTGGVVSAVTIDGVVVNANTNNILSMEDDGSGDATVNDVTVQHCNITNAANGGVYFTGMDVSGSQVNYNNILNNLAGIVNAAGNNSLNAECNWYGDISGPSGEGPGTGDSVGTNIDYIPWLTDAYPDGDCDGQPESLMIEQLVFDRGFPIRHAVDGDWGGAQSFSPTSFLDPLSYFTRAELYLRKFGAPEFDLTVELRTGSPEGNLIETVVIPKDDVPSTWTWFSVDFDYVDMDPGTDYYIVLPPAPSGMTTSFGYEWGYAFGNQYDGGSFWFTRDGGNLWRALPTMYEMTFKVYAMP